MYIYKNFNIDMGEQRKIVFYHMLLLLHMRKNYLILKKLFPYVKHMPCDGSKLPRSPKLKSITI